MLIRYIEDGWAREVSAPSSRAVAMAERIWKEKRPEMLEVISGSFRVLQKRVDHAYLRRLHVSDKPEKRAELGVLAAPLNKAEHQ